MVAAHPLQIAQVRRRGQLQPVHVGQCGGARRTGQEDDVLVAEAVAHYWPGAPGFTPVIMAL